MSKILILNVYVCVTCLRVTVSAVTFEGGTPGICLFDDNSKKKKRQYQLNNTEYIQ